MKKIKGVMLGMLLTAFFSVTHAQTNDQNKFPNTATDQQDSLSQDPFMNNIWGGRYDSYNYSDQTLDSNAVYRRLKDVLVMQGGQLKVIRNGKLFVMHGSFPLKNGGVVYTNGIVQMPGGATPVLDERNYIDFDGQIRPLQTFSN